MGRTTRRSAGTADLLAVILLLASGVVHGQQNTPVIAQTVLDLYGNGVEPWGSTQTAAMQQAAAQSVGHGTTASQVTVSVVSTYSQQQGRRRLRQSNQLVQPGVQLAVGVPTTESLVADIQTAMAAAVGSNQLVNAYKAQNGLQADYTSLVSQTTLNSNGKPVTSSTGSGSSSPSSGTGAVSSAGSGKGSGSSFPTWAVVVIVLLALALISIGAGYWAYRKWQVRKAIRAEAAKAASYFANTTLPRGGKFLEPANAPPKLTYKDFSSGEKGSDAAAAVPVSAGTPRAGDRPAPAYVPQRTGRLVDTLRGIGRI